MSSRDIEVVHDEALSQFHAFVLFLCLALAWCHSIGAVSVTAAVTLVVTAAVTLVSLPVAPQAVNTWLWFKVLQVDLVLILIDVLMPTHHHNCKLELKTHRDRHLVVNYCPC